MQSIVLAILASMSSALRAFPRTLRQKLSAPCVPTFSIDSFLLADTSISEEEILSVSGQVSDLPSPLFALAFAAIVFGGVAILQFSLGDLTKEEGQARVRDFLQTKRETERKRGYFDYGGDSRGSDTEER
jgi:hypothetical protein